MRTNSEHCDPDYPEHECVSENRIEIAVDDLEIGMFVGALDRPWLKSPFQVQGLTIRFERDIKKLQSLCKYVYVDKDKSDPDAIARYQARFDAPITYGTYKPKNDTRSSSAATDAAQKRGIRRTLASITKVFSSKRSREVAQKVERSFQVPERVVDETQSLVRRVIHDLSVGKSIDTRQAKSAITKCADQIFKNPDALLMFSNIKHKDTYTSEHSVNVAILSMLLGRRMQMPRRQLEEVGLAGLLHDVGKVFTPDEVLNKPNRLTDEEMLIMKMHPSQGRDILEDAEGLGKEILSVAHCHHERLNGSGYPRGLTESDLSV